MKQERELEKGNFDVLTKHFRIKVFVKLAIPIRLVSKALNVDGFLFSAHLLNCFNLLNCVQVYCDFFIQHFQMKMSFKQALQSV